MTRDADRRELTLLRLLRPHARAVLIGILAAIGEGLATLAEPWPLKIVLDNVLRAKPGPDWLNHVIFSVAGFHQIAIINFAALAILVIAAAGAVCSYIEKRLTTNIGQWVIHDLRQTLYSHIQYLSLEYHDQKQIGDLISRVTSDLDAIQGFINAGLFGALINGLTLAGMIGSSLRQPRISCIRISGTNGSTAKSSTTGTAQPEENSSTPQISTCKAPAASASHTRSHAAKFMTASFRARI